MLEGFVERACLRIANDLVVDLSRDALQYNFRKYHLCLNTLAHQRDRLLDASG